MGGVLNGLIAALTKRYYLIVGESSVSLNARVRSYQIAKGLTGTVNSTWGLSGDSFYGVALSANKKSVAATRSRVADNSNLVGVNWDNSTGSFAETNRVASFGTTNNTSTGRVAFAPDGNTVAAYTAGTSATPWIWAYPWNDSTGFGTKYANPASLPTNNTTSAVPLGVTFNPSGTAIAMGGASSPFIHAYPWSSGFGTKYANPASVPNNPIISVKFNPAGDVLLASGFATNFIPGAWAWSSGFGTKYANPATQMGLVTDGVWNSAGSVVLLSGQSSPYINAYPWSSGWGTKYANPATLPTSSANTITLAENETSVYIGVTNSPYIVGYDWSTSSGFGTKFANPATALSLKINSITSNG